MTFILDNCTKSAQFGYLINKLGWL